MRHTINLDDLSYSAVDAKPVDADWSELGLDYEQSGEGGFYFWEADRCEEEHTLDQIVDAASDLDIDLADIPADDLDAVLVSTTGECPACGHEHYREGPMMNYYYPIDLDEDEAEEAAKSLVDVPLCVVRVGSQMGLALTGGGMDLSWEICEAFLTLGYAPPAHFARDLPDFGTLNRKHLAILQGCLKSLEAQERWTGGGVERVRNQLKEAGVDVDGD